MLHGVCDGTLMEGCTSGAHRKDKAVDAAPTFTMRSAMQRSRDAGSCAAASSSSRQKGKDPADCKNTPAVSWFCPTAGLRTRKDTHNDSVWTIQFAHMARTAQQCVQQHARSPHIRALAVVACRAEQQLRCLNMAGQQIRRLKMGQQS